MSNINNNLEEMIHMFFKYGAKTELSVDEFLQFRKQAISEKLSGVTDKPVRNDEDNRSGMTNIQIKELSKDVDCDNKYEVSQNRTDVGLKKCKDDSLASQTLIHDASQKQGKMSVNTEESVIHDKPVTEENEFTEEDFLKMMREIED